MGVDRTLPREEFFDPTLQHLYSVNEMEATANDSVPLALGDFRGGLNADASRRFLSLRRDQL